ncbi:MAG: DUF4293 family protein [Bacteroidaceae bacterium]|nr:DUF4293 family protein [Bacteroidaceae bacterium]
MPIKFYLHQLWLIAAFALIVADLFLPIAMFGNQEGSTALLTNFRILYVEGAKSAAFWALGVILICTALINLFELLLSGFQNFTLQKRSLVLSTILIAGYYVLYLIYILCMKADASYTITYGTLFPVIALIFNVMAFRGVCSAEAQIIKDSFRLRD